MARQSNTAETTAASTAGAPTAADTAKPKQFKIPAHVMYLGPTFTWNGVRFLHKQIFNNGVPVSWLEWIASEPEFRLLFVEVGQTPKRLADLKNADSPVSLAYRKAEEAIRKYKPGK